MVNPSLSSLLEKENVNRYTLVVATAKAARHITDEYIAQREFTEKNTIVKEFATSLKINEKYRDERAVQNAIEEIYDGDYKLIQNTLPYGQGHGESADEEAEKASETDAEE